MTTKSELSQAKNSFLKFLKLEKSLTLFLCIKQNSLFVLRMVLAVFIMEKQGYGD